MNDYIVDYSINTSMVVSELGSHWRKFERSFLSDTVITALRLHLIGKGERTTTELNDDFHKTKYPAQEMAYMDHFSKPENFPIPIYFTYHERSKRGYTSLIEYHVSCKVELTDPDFDLFFALQFYLTDIMDSASFLQFHLDETFENNLTQFADYVENVCLKYDFFLGEKHQKIAEKFLKKASEKLEKTTEKSLKNFEKDSENSHHSVIQVETAGRRLAKALAQFGFFDLPIIKVQNNEQARCFVDSLSMYELPFLIALVHEIGFVEHLKKAYYPTKAALYKGLSEILDCNERAVKGNCLVLQPKTTENKDRYTAHKHKKDVEKVCEQLKLGVRPAFCP